MAMKYFFILALATISALGHAESIERVEPPFWWSGMAEPSLQLMVYGDNIGSLDVNIEHPDVALEQVHRVENANYLFLDLQVGSDFDGGQVAIEFLSEADVKAQHDYAFLTRRTGSSERNGFSAADAIYLITPDRFANANPNLDNHPDMLEKADRESYVGRHGGDIAGIRQHLDYIADMGFTAIWPTPMLENNQEAYSYHGYSTTDFYRIDPRFGSNEDFRQLSLDARAQGIGLVQDMILNHIGSMHWWMDDLPMDDWLNFQDGFFPTTHYRTTVQDPYSAEVDRKEFTDGWFVETMPDLNQRNPFMAQYLIQNSIWWIEFADLYGIRTDTYSYSDKDFLTEWTRRVMTEYPDFNIVGEEWSTNPNVVSYWQRGKDNADGYVSYLPSVMDFPLYDNLRTALNEPEEWGQGLIRIYESLADDTLYPDPMNLVIFAENHDTSRLYSHYHERADKFNIAMAMLATMRGIPQFFYGSELLATSPRERADGEVRSDFPGGWEGDERNGFTGEGMADEELAAQDYLRRLLNWRQGQSAIHSGELLHFAPVEGVYVYFRYDESQTIMVAINHTESEQSIDVERYREGIGQHAWAQDVIDGTRHPLEETLTLAPMLATVFELK